MYADYKDQLEYQRNWRKNNRDKVSAAKQRYYIKKPLKQFLKTAKSGAKKRGLEFSITEDDIHMPEVCPVLGTPFERGTMYAASIDRIDNSKGYVQGNVQIISKLANTMKSQATQEELIKFAEWVMSK